MVVKPFDQCLARPNQHEEFFLLKEHLLKVARCWGEAAGDYSERLYFLGGLCHDAAKARTEWQLKLTVGKLPIHSVPSALLFSFYAVRLLNTWEKAALFSNTQKNILKNVIFRIVRDICDHHGKLGDIDNEYPLSKVPSKEIVFSDMDLTGFHEFVCNCFPEFRGTPLPTPEILHKWKRDFENSWDDWRVGVMANAAQNVAKMEKTRKERVERRLGLRDKTAAFIVGDRFDAAGIKAVNLHEEMVRKALEDFNGYCQDKAEASLKSNPQSEAIVKKRHTAQAQSLEQFRNHPHQVLYALSLPTGLGKTLTSTRMALEACLLNQRSRIIYAAPYISILSQASREIGEATGLEVLQHHHLAVLNEKNPDDRDTLIMESWQSPVVATTFNQLFRALFPNRAQELIRLPALQDAFIIIDEPQIIETPTWNLFLVQLETAATLFNCQVLFISATLPPFEHAELSALPFKVSTTVEVPSRFIMKYDAQIQTETSVAQALVQSQETSVCAVMNTVRDACQVYQATRERLLQEKKTIVTLEQILNAELPEEPKPGAALFNLNGLMTPIHKELQIAVISNVLKTAVSEKCIAVSTQMLEAGVDLSFRTGLRPRAIIPSQVQFSGRVNRHGEEDREATVTIMNFLRNGEKDTRKWVYVSQIERDESDSIMKECSGWNEKKCLEKLQEYYQRTFKRNANTSKLGLFAPVSRGKWSLFAGQEPFGKSYETNSVFVPWPDRRQMEAIVQLYQNRLTLNGTSTMEKVLNIMVQYSLDDVDDIYKMYAERERMGELDFSQRKQFMALMQQFIVQVSGKMRWLTVQYGDLPIRRLAQPELYSLETGLGHHVGVEDQELYF